MWWTSGLLFESHDAIRFIDSNDPESAAFVDRNFDRRERCGGVLLDVEPQHLRVVHLVHVVAGEDDDVSRVLALEGVQVLVHGVGSAEVPVFTDSLLRRQDLDELAELLGDDTPPHAHVAAQRERFVLSSDEDSPQPRVDAVAEGEVDDAVRTTEVDRRLGSIPGQGI